MVYPADLDMVTFVAQAPLASGLESSLVDTCPSAALEILVAHLDVLEEIVASFLALGVVFLEMACRSLPVDLDSVAGSLDQMLVVVSLELTLEVTVVSYQAFHMILLQGRGLVSPWVVLLGHMVAGDMFLECTDYLEV